MSVSNEYSYLLNSIAQQEGFELTDHLRLSGGDINDVFKLTFKTGEKLVIKINDRSKYPGMFEAEKNGLEALAVPAIFKIPRVLSSGDFDTYSYLILEFIESGKPSGDFNETFGRNLAQLHKTTSTQFGFDTDNYIGSLPQKNRVSHSAANFYYNQRLVPQFQLAKKNGFDLGSTEFMEQICTNLIPEEPPALVHGDLWNGNYLITASGAPCLIDPAVAFAPREMDLGMMKLFGGFNANIFKVYEEEFSLKKGFEERLPLWQLYYLLVHLNIFGIGYKNRVTGILKNYRQY